jgi:hypothetical protein
MWKTYNQLKSWRYSFVSIALIGLIIGGCAPSPTVHDLQHGYISKLDTPDIDTADIIEPKALPQSPRKASKEELAMLQLVAGQETTIPDVPLESRSDQLNITGFESTCDIRFKDEVALLILPDHARYTFAYPPWYIEGCGRGWFHLMENSNRYQEAYRSHYRHYHLGWDGFCINFSTGNSGVQSGGSCMEVDPIKQDRSVNPHRNDEWLRGYVYKSGEPEIPFDLLRMRIRENGIRMWVRKSSGNWLHYTIPVGYWTINQADNIREILISGQGGAGIWEIDDLRIRVP